MQPFALLNNLRLITNMLRILLILGFTFLSPLAAHAKTGSFWGSAPFKTKFVTDRPSRSESSQTVEAGRVQIEMDLVNYVYGQQDVNGSQADVIDRKYLSPNFKVGINSTSDFEVITGWLRQKSVAVNGQSRSHRSQEDTTFRFKKNVYKSADQKMSLTLMPTVTMSTGFGADDRINGQGLIVPLDYNLDGPYSINLTNSIHREVDLQTQAVENIFLTAVSFQVEWPHDLQSYVELANEISDQQRQAAMTFDLGLLYQIYDDIQLDAGCHFGLTSAADRLNPFAGFSTRF